MQSVCRLVRTSGNKENECQLVNARSVYVDQYAINESDQEDELNKAKPDGKKNDLAKTGHEGENEKEY